MSTNARKPEHWVDELREKHECGGYRNPIAIQIVHEGQTLDLLSPFTLERAEILSTTLSESAGLIYLVAKEPRRHEEPPFAGILVVAKRRGPGSFEVVVWHDLYPWAIERLGLHVDHQI